MPLVRACSHGIELDCHTINLMQVCTLAQSSYKNANATTTTTAASDALEFKAMSCYAICQRARDRRVPSRTSLCVADVRGCMHNQCLAHGLIKRRSCARAHARNNFHYLWPHFSRVALHANPLTSSTVHVEWSLRCDGDARTICTCLH